MEGAERRGALLRTAAEQAATLKSIQPPARAESKSKRRQDINQHRQLLAIASANVENRTNREVDILVAHLSKIHCLRDIEFPVLREVVRGMSGVSAPVNTHIVSEGEPAQAFYVVVRGKLLVTQAVPGTNSARQVAKLGPRACFGELALCFGKPRSATVTTASEDCLLLKLNALEFHESLGAAISASLVRESEELRAFAPFAPLPSEALMELLYGFEHVRFKPKETLLMQAPLRGEEAACPLFFVRVGVVAMFMDPNYAANDPKKSTASTNASSCTMVYAMSSGDVVGDWNLVGGQASAHAVALTIVTAYRIRRAELFRRIPSADTSKQLLADARKNAAILAKHQKSQKQRSKRQLMQPSLLMSLTKSMPTSIGLGMQVSAAEPDSARSGHVPVPPFTMLPEVPGAARRPLETDLDMMAGGPLGGPADLLATARHEASAANPQQHPLRPASDSTYHWPTGSSEATPLQLPPGGPFPRTTYADLRSSMLEHMGSYTGSNSGPAVPAFMPCDRRRQGALASNRPIAMQHMGDALRGVAQTHDGQQALAGGAASACFNLPGAGQARPQRRSLEALPSPRSQRDPTLLYPSASFTHGQHRGLELRPGIGLHAPAWPMHGVHSRGTTRCTGEDEPHAAAPNDPAPISLSLPESGIGESLNGSNISPGELQTRRIGVGHRPGRLALEASRASLDEAAGATAGALVVISGSGAGRATNIKGHPGHACKDVGGTGSLPHSSAVTQQRARDRRRSRMAEAEAEAETEPHAEAPPPVESIFLLPLTSSKDSSLKDAARAPRGRLLQKIDYYGSS